VLTNPRIQNAVTNTDSVKEWQTLLVVAFLTHVAARVVRN
ncbi:MAG: hypothetical protein RLY35_853, partial [Bacteroidota bacterium]